jgi:hypothetical protein
MRGLVNAAWIVTIGIILSAAVMMLGCPKPAPGPVNPTPDASDAARPVSCPAACAAFVKVCPGAAPSCATLCARVSANVPSYPGCVAAAATCTAGDNCDPITSTAGGAAKPHGH